MSQLLSSWEILLESSLPLRSVLLFTFSCGRVVFLSLLRGYKGKSY